MARRPDPRSARRAAHLEELAALRARVSEAEDLLRAIGRGEVDAIVRQGPAGDQVFTLEGADRPYRMMVEAMAEGALSLTTDGAILYANARFAELIGCDDGQLDIARQGAREIRVDGTLRPVDTRGLDEDQLTRAHLPGDPRGNAVAGHVPRMRKRIGVSQPSRRPEDRHTAAADRRANLAGIVDQRRLNQTLRDHLRVLIHRSDRHPVRRVVG